LDPKTGEKFPIQPTQLQSENLLIIKPQNLVSPLSNNLPKISLEIIILNPKINGETLSLGNKNNSAFQFKVPKPLCLKSLKTFSSE